MLAACGDDAEAPSAEQDREMDRAAEMLNEAPESLSQVDDQGLAAEQERSEDASAQAANE